MQRENTKIKADEVTNAVLGNVLAGTDTTTISLCAIFYEFCMNLAVLRELNQELKTASVQAKVSDPITYKETSSLEYFQAVIKEALRVHLATGFTAQGCFGRGCYH